MARGARARARSARGAAGAAQANQAKQTDQAKTANRNRGGGTVRGGGIKNLGRGKRYATGIDIGSFSVKIITIAGDEGGNIAVQAVTVVPLARPEGPEYPEEKHQRQAEALKEAVKKHGKVQGRIVLGFPRHSATIRYLSLPSSNPDELKEMVFFDAERHVPIPLNEMEISFQIIEQLGEHESRVMMVAVPTDELEPYITMCEEAGIDVNAIDLDVLADVEAYSRSAAPGETIAVVNFGRSAVNMGVVKDQHLLFSRSLPVPETRLLAGFAGANSLKDLQGRVTAAGVLNPKEREHFSAWVERLSMELMRSVSSFLCEMPDTHIDRMILCGGAGYFPAGPPRALTVKVKTKVTVENALNGELPPSDQYQGTELVTVTGLALRGLKPPVQTLNLIPEEVTTARAKEQRSIFRKNVMIFFFMILVLIGGGGFLHWYQLYEDFQRVDGFYSDLNLEAKQVSAMNKKIKVVENYIDTRQSCINVLQNVFEELKPFKIWISNITFSKRETLQINGQALNETEINKINHVLNELRPAPGEPTFFTNVFPGQSQPTMLDLDSKQMQVYNFSFHCTLRWTEDIESNL